MIKNHTNLINEVKNRYKRENFYLQDLTDRLNNIDKSDLICHRHVTWEMIQKEMQKNL